jgi:intracellular sulfur oxidation DsrE/DsrF family protein
MTDHDGTTESSRRKFMGMMAANAALLVAAGCARTPETAGVALAATPANGNGATKGKAKFDDSWTEKLGRHRVVFEVNEFNGAAGLVGTLMDSYRDGIGATDKDLGFAIVLRHGVVTMAMKESAWQKYPIGEALKYNDREGKPRSANNYAKTIETLLGRGVIILACNVGFTGAVNMISNHVKADKDQVRSDLLAAMYPGVYLQPNGIYALLRAQNVGAAYWKLS